MATIRKRGSRWQVQVRRLGHTPLTRTFTLKPDAERWAKACEAGLERGDHASGPKVTAVPLRDLLIRYEAEVSATKKGRLPERYMLRTIKANAMADTALDRLTTARIATYRDERLKRVAPGSVRRELAILRHCLEVARKEWGAPLAANPLDDLTWPNAGKPRERRVTQGELEGLAAGLRSCRNPMVASVVTFAIATGMRRGEILSFTWGDVNVPRRFVRLHDTKNGSPRSVPLSPMALDVLQSLAQGQAAARVFPMSPNALRLSWERLKRRAGIVDLRFHDLRHEAISRFFEAGLSVPEVSLISGHKDPRMLFRYTHIRPETVAARLENLREQGVTGVEPA